MLLLPSILISLFLLMQLVTASSARTLAPYLSKKKPNFDTVDKMLAPHQDHWPTGVLNVKALKASFEAGEMSKVAAILNRLKGEDLPRVSRGNVLQNAWSCCSQRFEKANPSFGAPSTNRSDQMFSFYPSVLGKDERVH